MKPWLFQYRDRAGQQQLAAHVVLKHGPAVTEQELKIHARKKLPEYMIPPSIRFLDALPLTPNGKIDRKALPALSSNGTGESAKEVQAALDLERVIAGLWQDALGVDAVGLQVNLFDLGANSLVWRKLRRVSGKNLSAKYLLPISLPTRPSPRWPHT